MSLLYAGLGQLPSVTALFFGLKAAVLAIVIEALLRIGKRALKSRPLVLLAGVAFIALFCFEVPFPLVIAGAALVGALGSHVLPRAFPFAASAQATIAHDTVIARMAAAGELAHTQPNLRRTLRVLLIGAVLWGLPLVLLRLWLGANSVFFQEGAFFSRAALVTFGGAYAVLAYVAQQAVATFHWLRPGEMLDGLGLAETTPGPLVMVVQFVGFMGAFRHPGGLPPLLAGTFGALVTTWVTFVPCFLWIFVGAPYIEAVRGSRWLAAALAAITAAVVGVIANLSLWFGLHVLFKKIDVWHFGPLRLLLPELATTDIAAVVLAGLALLSLFRLKLGVPKTLAACALLGVAWRWVGGA